MCRSISHFLFVRRLDDYRLLLVAFSRQLERAKVTGKEEIRKREASYRLSKRSNTTRASKLSSASRNGAIRISIRARHHKDAIYQGSGIAGAKAINPRTQAIAMRTFRKAAGKKSHALLSIICVVHGGF